MNSIRVGTKPKSETDGDDNEFDWGDQDQENVPDPDVQYRKVETDFWEGQDRSGDLDYSQRTRVLKQLVPNLRKVSLAEGLTAYDFGDRLNDAEQVVDDIARALCAFWQQKLRRSGLGRTHISGMIWYNPGLSCLQSKPEDWNDASPVSKNSLDDATAEYLRHPGMRRSTLGACLRMERRVGGVRPTATPRLRGRHAQHRETTI